MGITDRAAAFTAAPLIKFRLEKELSAFFIRIIINLLKVITSYAYSQ
jgi:hypothetical protein